MPQCVVKSCKSGLPGFAGATFFKFPMQDKIRKNRWLRGLGLVNFKPDNESKVCSRHFKKVCKTNQNGLTIPNILYSFNSQSLFHFMQCNSKLEDKAESVTEGVKTSPDQPKVSDE